ncbi:unnamed protein product [Owenia fusiformis]|uniref:Uncharacterized protein n=1 Tax=Owenia fusiformis TaxID=6347 RepID=A0A8J1U1E0_OWEFU|nr:unnamed protein product [Owenia fusiformis]
MKGQIRWTYMFLFGMIFLLGDIAIYTLYGKNGNIQHLGSTQSQNNNTIMGQHYKIKVAHKTQNNKDNIDLEYLDHIQKMNGDSPKHVDPSNDIVDNNNQDNLERNQDNMDHYYHENVDQIKPFGLYSKANKQLVFYNRMPKCGSSTMLHFLRRLRKKFKHIHSHKYWEPKLSHKNLQAFIKSFAICNATSKQYVFDRHIYFIHFEMFGYQQPIYFNIIREPLEQTLSWYYYMFKRMGSKSRKNERKQFFVEHKNQTFEECIRENMNSSSLDQKCFLDKLNKPTSYVEWFCGHDDKCSDMSYGIPKAKYNIEKYYMLIGLTEEYNLTLLAMEKLLPSFFKDIEQFNPNMTRINVVPAAKKVRPSTEIVTFMKEHLKFKYEIYNFVQQKFHLTMKKLKINNFSEH